MIPGFRGALRATAGRRRIAAAALVGLLVVAVVAATVGGVPGGDSGADRTLVVTYENGTELAVAPVDDDTEIVIEYTHSVEKTLVRDVYVATNDGLRMTRMEFSSFGAGLPSRADVTERDGRYVYYPPPTEYRTLHLKTGLVADHDLIVGDRRYDIAGLSEGGAVELTVERRGLFGL
ncbi:DUF1850 domain-containing protein [Halorubrum sp. DM2]|uniref:DUF1850 domain-containing protein n=1 Tax=Halorubrum sp. DM2 TaxID=2527867 RepID=UPI0024B64BC4|nr:DUF1850 domain-containing protein [Halorubrum sp. DM2]VTT88019.1 DUF1850 domain-containing protein [Halorubrum sp. DM2]